MPEHSVKRNSLARKRTVVPSVDWLRSKIVVDEQSIDATEDDINRIVRALQIDFKTGYIRREALRIMHKSDTLVRLRILKQMLVATRKSARHGSGLVTNREFVYMLTFPDQGDFIGGTAGRGLPPFPVEN